MSARRDDEAARWFARADRGPLTPEDRTAFLEWLETPGAAQAYQENADAWSQLGAARGAEGMMAMRAAALRDAAGVNRRWAMFGALAAAGAGGAGLMVATTAGATIRTGRGERLVSPLPDGSSVTLAPLSMVRVRYSEARRQVKLYEGQAYFDARMNAERPFEVVVGDQRALGSGGRFQITRRGDAAAFLIEEGALDVASDSGGLQRLTGGQMVAGPAGARRVAAADLDELTAWRDGRLVFSDAPLSQVAEAFNRYSGDRLSVADGAQLDGIRVSGSFRYDGTREFTQALQTGFGLQVRQLDRTSWEIAP